MRSSLKSRFSVELCDELVATNMASRFCSIVTIVLVTLFFYLACEAQNIVKPICKPGYKFIGGKCREIQ